ncbi:MAG: fibronectin type III domain-containing protein, partial [Actinobacteria bacterium]|nr:fibronectin type III domain-containing protein [Candidatus Fonsibacter lacus]
MSPTTASTVRGLTTGTSYLFRVAAISEQGSGAFSPASSAITPAAAPDTPAKPTGSANGTSITITWTAPNANGATISSYNVSYSSDSGNTWTSVAPASTTSATVANLTIALTYIFR